MAVAKKAHLNIWQYGDITADDAKEFGAKQAGQGLFNKRQGLFNKRQGLLNKRQGLFNKRICIGLEKELIYQQL